MARKTKCACGAVIPPARARLGLTRCIDCAKANPSPGRTYVQTASGFKNNGASLSRIEDLADYQRDNTVRG
jgi:hypothetical protein